MTPAQATLVLTLYAPTVFLFLIIVLDGIADIAEDE